MSSYGTRRGPLQSTPANVQCQKCLKRGHYSYECKASAQDRPYVSRPSRSQQLRNPKLVPELTGLEPPASKKGIADAIIAEREAQHARERGDGDHEETKQHLPRRLEPASVSSKSKTAESLGAGYSRHPIDRTRSPIPTRRGRSPFSPGGEHRRSRRRTSSRSPQHHPARNSAPLRLRRGRHSEPEGDRRSLSRTSSRSPPHHRTPYPMVSRREHGLESSEGERQPRGGIYNRSSEYRALSPLPLRRSPASSDDDIRRPPRHTNNARHTKNRSPPRHRTRSPTPSHWERSPKHLKNGQRLPRSLSYSRSPQHPRQISRDARFPHRRGSGDSVDPGTSEPPRREVRPVDKTSRGPQRVGLETKGEFGHVRRYRSRSPEMKGRGYQREPRGPRHGRHEPARDDGTSQRVASDEAERDRSLSPFSKRLAMTRAMNSSAR
ncbi:hypothetical protein XA68_12154 [Ophiocordyceps unilateralis]|uniref:Zinc knuckle-domain-containing protein n=1 Tax=Ophiocordyceps unilateralis TaxID=268505 RepID=A0A2A9PPI5_OPHUN|nr:hypothetical protein XA68_12154 [Ophiocordyceps unilateralis]